MPTVERAIVIDRPLEGVFAFFANSANESRWRA
jgi:hypothetical protein